MGFLHSPLRASAALVLGKPGRPQPTPQQKLRQKVDFKIISANPHKVLFTRPYINDHFTCGRSVQSTIDDLSGGRIAASDLPLITVVSRNDRLMTLDHRRLYAMQAALPPDATVHMRMLSSGSEWFNIDTYVPVENCKYYHAVRVEPWEKWEPNLKIVPSVKSINSVDIEVDENTNASVKATARSNILSPRTRGDAIMRDTENLKRRLKLFLCT